MKVHQVVRLVLSLVLVYGVYTETGFFTGLFAFLVIVHTEVVARMLFGREH